MIESLLFIILLVIGILSLIIALINLFKGINKNSAALKKSALLIGVVPVICFGLIAFWFALAIPSSNASQMEDFSGRYKIDTSSKDLLISYDSAIYITQLTLSPDGTYTFHGIECLGFEEKGIWKTGGIDGYIKFTNEYGGQPVYGSPSNSGLNAVISFDLNLDNCEDKYGRILFKKNTSN